ncbi:MAG: conjugative transfer system coupling protein TraD [Pseudomonadota bacterium]|jgi:conjugal transfer pilus assembly protein TraD
MDQRVKDMWRPVYEQWAALGWMGAVAGLMFAAVPFKPIVAGICGGLALVRARQALEMYRFRLAISGQYVLQTSVEDLLKQTDLALNKYQGLWLGRGFQWTQRHAQLSKEILDRNPSEIPTVPSWVMKVMDVGKTIGERLPEWVPSGIRRALAPKDKAADPHKMVGASWVHGLEPGERDLYLPLSALPGHTLIVGTTRSYKAQPLDALVHTANGWKRMGDVSIGDMVSVPSGGVAPVTGVFPQGEVEIFRLTFDDGRTVEACGDHLWEIHHKHRNGKYKPGISRAGRAQPRIMSTNELRAQMERNKGTFAVRLCGAVDRPAADLPLHPYVLGCILGDGLISKGDKLTFTSADEDIVARIRTLLPENLDLRPEASDPKGIEYRFCIADGFQNAGWCKGTGRTQHIIHPLKSIIKELGLSGHRSWEKFVPEVYMNASAEQRLALLQGLMDTDGSISTAKGVLFTSSSERLARNVQELVWSLGGIAKLISRRPAKYTGADGTKEGRPYWVVSICMPDPGVLFQSARKLKKAAGGRRLNRNLKLRVTKIEPAGRKPAQCILIDHPEHLYITDGYVVTHNTRLYELLTFQAVHSGATVIVFDPKGDKDWERRLRAESKRCGRDYLYFHLAFPSKSVRLNPLATWNNPSEIGSRISQLLAGEGGGDGFVEFADSTINRVVAGQVMVGLRPTLKSIKHYVEHGVDELLEQCFHVFFVPREGANWDAAIAPYLQKAKSRVDAMAHYYQERCVKERGERNETIDGLITILNYDRDWFSRVIVRLVPLLQRLATGDLGDLLSPDVENLDDPRPVYTMDKIISGRKVLYVGSDTLSNKLGGASTMSMLLADLAAAAGAAYNFSEQAADVYLFMDEAAEGINDQAIQILNKAGGAGFKAFIATQTVADFEVRLGKKPKALQVLGNTNNLICGRVRDYETAKVISQIMGETALRKVSTSHNQGSETEATMIEFRGSVTKSMGEKEAPLVSPDVLTRLPNLQYFAMVAGGRIVKGRLPVIGG